MRCPSLRGPKPKGQAQKETCEFGIMYYPHQEIYTTAGFPQSLRPLQNMEVAKAVRAQLRGFGAHTQVLRNVEENEQRGGPSTAQSSAHRIGPTGCSSTSNHNEAKSWVKATCTHITMSRWDTLLPLD
jgi:hypothetical protein